MDEYKNNINPFTNQPILPPNPPFNPPGEAKPPVELKKEIKPAKPANKFDLKIIFLYLVLISLGGVLAKYAFDFFVPKQPKPSTLQSKSAANKPAGQPFIKIVAGKQPSTASSADAGKKQEQPFLSLKKKINQTVNPYNLSGIFASGSKSYCIVNDKVLGLGDTIEGAKVVRIDTDEVELQLNDKSIKLNLRGK
jgi:hypothetical protein